MLFLKTSLLSLLRRCGLQLCRVIFILGYDLPNLFHARLDRERSCPYRLPLGSGQDIAGSTARA
jgi:hypothetical protein